MNFDGIPSNGLVPFFYSEFNNREAVDGNAQSYKALVIAQKLAAAPGPAEVLTRTTSEKEASNLFGEGSQAARMVEFFKKTNKFTDIWVIALDDSDTGVAAAGTIALSGTVTKAGSIVVYIAGRRVAVGVAAGETAAAAAAKLKTEIEKYPSIPFTVAIATSTLTLTAKNKGEVANYHKLMQNYYTGEVTPAGLTVTLTQPTGGATNPDVTSAIALITAQQFNAVITPYVDISNANIMETHMKDMWGPMKQKEGVHFGAHNGTLSDLTTFTNARNNHLEVFPAIKGIPEAPEEVAAGIAACYCFSAENDPAMPLQTLQVVGVKAPKPDEEFDMTEKEILLRAGASTLGSTPDGKVLIERLVTTYTQNELGADDPSYRNLETISTLSFMRYDVRNYFLRKYPRWKLSGDDDAQFSPDQDVMTPKLYKSELINIAKGWERDGLAENMVEFMKNITVGIDPNSPDGIVSEIKPDLVNQLRIHKNKITFKV